MLRFDVPAVWSNVIRWEAFITFALSLVSWLVSPWFMVPLVLMGFVRGFIGHHRCPSHHLWKKVFGVLKILGKQEDAGAKMFANKILFVASTACMALFFNGSSLWQIPCIVLMVFSLAEWSLKFCAACWAYTLWYRFKPMR